VGAHDAQATFVDGDVYYRKGDAERRALGIPRVDDHVYGHENGLAIAAFAALYEATRDARVLERAKLAADVVMRELVTPEGAVKRGKQGARYLADAASLGRGLARLAAALDLASRGDGTPYREAARRILTVMEHDLFDEATGAFWDRTVDPAAAGVFARRMQPFAPNLLAVRFLATLGRATDSALTQRARRTLAAICTPRALDERGRMLGEVLLAFDDAGVIPWP
jgi:uncharacterized protein YyaL (SSP411 family)